MKKTFLLALGLMAAMSFAYAQSEPASTTQTSGTKVVKKTTVHKHVRKAHKTADKPVKKTTTTTTTTDE